MKFCLRFNQINKKSDYQLKKKEMKRQARGEEN